MGEYIESIAGPAFSYLNLTNADQDSSDSPSSVIIFILNANIWAQTFCNIVSNLIASSRTKTSENIRPLQVSVEKAKKILILHCIMVSEDPRKRDFKEAESWVATLTAATKEHQKNYDHDKCSIRIGLEKAICALEWAGIDEK